MHPCDTVEMLYANNSPVSSDFHHFFGKQLPHCSWHYIYIYISFHESGAGKTSPAVTDIDS